MNNLKVMSTLADETRYRIYHYVLQHQKSFTVQNIAEQFDIHPNVARLHLTKLCEIGIVHAEYVKSGKGGRPGRVYNASKDGIVISFPKRDYEKLLSWTLELISLLGDSAVDSLKSISYKDGYNEMSTLTKKQLKDSITFEEKIELLAKAAYQIGYVPSIIEKDGTKQVILSIYNCPFKNQLEGNAHLICSCHESYLKGQIDVLFPNNDFIQINSMLNSCNNCQYKIKIADSQ
ncbi:helix-turn-helix transcriptional regulator [Ureibacillus acetophenoni]|uniref:Predicted ArsR family transcriptional regulator n=1 Tax=Ureibacillus acetophenoni TaxID=614649 RepID=A0A285U6P8_9BACL|nr:helix-turn-helix domain-containing protein [Ureibacillus acetophenoni]SOC36216.1 predicted ArsR family transcriptional regulator [Ureibacillus acetophenoni]